MDFMYAHSKEVFAGQLIKLTFIVQEYKEQLQFKTWQLVKLVHTQLITYAVLLLLELEIIQICIYFIQNGNSKVYQKIHPYKTKLQIHYLFYSLHRFKDILQDQLYSQITH